MKKLLLLSAALLLAGCGHNTVSYGDGVMLETTINPESYAFGVSFRYGKILTACVRENAELEMQGAGSGNAGTGKDAVNSTGASSTGAVKLKIGRQVTGYYVDALKAGATAEDVRKYTEPDKQNAEAPKQDAGETDKKKSETDAAKTEAVTPTAEAVVK